MTSCDELERELEEFKNNLSGEFLLKPIERWMTTRLRVSRLKNTGGSKVRYEHPALEELKLDGIFVVHLVHGKKQDTIWRKNFLNFLYPQLKYIIEYMRKEGLCGDEKSRLLPRS